VSALAAGSLPGELVDLKQVRVAGAADPLADSAFARAWAALAAGDDPERVALRETARALVATRLAGIDEAVLADAGLTGGQARAVLGRALDEACGAGVDPALAARLHDALDDAPGTTAPAPPFAAALAAQPRAGATAPGRPRLLLSPAESHAGHCLVAAVLAVLLAPEHGALPARPFLCGLAHHLHNARLPDAGFAGETLLGEHLDDVVRALRERALAELDEPLRSHARVACALAEHAGTPEARAFVAADVLDRVLQMRVYERQATFRLRMALDDLELVHAGPLQEFGRRMVAEAGLA
jgi:5'-deoxynucleotidase YfbR-like HD superfamily hydrolase